MKIEVNLSKDDIKELKELNEKLASMKSLLAEDVLGKILTMAKSSYVGDHRIHMKFFMLHD